MKVRDLIRQLESAGWVLRSTKGSHRQFKHPQKASVVTVAVQFHIEGLRAEGLAVPPPASWAGTLDIAAA